MILRTLKIMILFIPLCVFIGCNDMLVHEGEPVIDRVAFSASCSEGEIEGPYMGYDGNYVIIYFSTSNVNQEFEIEYLIDSPVVPPSEIPHATVEPVFTVVQHEPGKSIGIVRATFIIHTYCYSDGPYEISIAITDANDDTGYFNTQFEVMFSLIRGVSDCLCVSQCGACKKIRFTKATRCNCGCPLYAEKCND